MDKMEYTRKNKIIRLENLERNQKKERKDK
jgi:hypothetical protein